MIRVDVEHADDQLSELVQLTERGQHVLISRAGRAVARLVRIPPGRPVGEAFGVLRGEIVIADDFDALPDDFLEHFR